MFSDKVNISFPLSVMPIVCSNWAILDDISVSINGGYEFKIPLLNNCCKDVIDAYVSYCLRLLFIYLGQNGSVLKLMMLKI